MNVFIQLTIAGEDTGPFNLYTEIDGFVSPFQTDIEKAELLLGSTYYVPDGATIIRVMSNSEFCKNYVDIPITTTTTTTATPIPTEGCFDSVTVTFNTDITFDYTDCQSVVVTLGLLASDSPHTINRLDCINIATLTANEPFEIIAVGNDCSEEIL